MDPTITWWITQLGFPGALCFMLWRVLVFFKPHVIECIPYFKSILTSHISLVNTLETQVKNGGDKLDKITNTQEEHGHKLDELIKGK